ncbi:RsmF rRNA methyltransferase first C-terminal domain-containing protein [Pseudobacteroides cellulosolvens]|uniref:RNA methylase, NOL1/NOP2/sun family n=1 Tax=Pseudobacteroides cellulosolvens ATCC 35603 = DSM 2933 TaxID=398512 RepID=A0A0L6JLJ1_9FIRM|nr:RsmB/NOP family class I SAM-dependent RNA methyltransferase [Pseudobacteroides cellulosolvens]KNY26625.1 RNA methylase, NOL1/NOP2/sun family [Pseudobacteroides cellulosolvens ATCC 35603 = DSM 2933]
MKLPLEFLEKMKNLLGEEEYKLFMNSFEKPRFYGLRINTLKVSIEDFIKISPFKLTPIPWTKDGFYYSGDYSPGKHPYYNAGLYYIQEPSAMYPGFVADARPGERILDLCAAPGGKSVQLAAGLEGKGILVSNDINADRVKALVKNIELCGIKNAVVTNETPDNLARRFGAFFDKVLVDAPCSGEGMFRKDEEAQRSWSNFKSDKCAVMQRDILESADKLLKPGGYLIYSTCTFSPEEDEMMISEFLQKHSDYTICDVPKCGGIDDGRPEWSDGDISLLKTSRLWPHKLDGEGHFTAMLRKGESIDDDGKHDRLGMNASGKLDKALLDEFFRFTANNFNCEIKGRFELMGSHLYCLPFETPSLDGLKIAKFGWYLGEFNKGKFNPSHSMVISLKKEDINNVLELSSSSNEVLSYLKGETLIREEQDDGLTCVCVDGYTLGWAKCSGGVIKNQYPKGWRRMC